jgi:hypothetical protein
LLLWVSVKTSVSYCFSNDRKGTDGPPKFSSLPLPTEEWML